jgi:hypothetical protein
MRDVLTAPTTSRQAHFHTDWGRACPDIARHQSRYCPPRQSRILNPCLLNEAESYDVVSNIRLALASGRAQRQRMQRLHREITQRIFCHFDRMSASVEELKYAGMPGRHRHRKMMAATSSTTSAR